MNNLKKTIFAISICINLVFLASLLLKNRSNQFEVRLVNKSNKAIQNIHLKLNNDRGARDLISLDILAQESRAVFSIDLVIQGESDMTIEFVDSESNLHKKTIIGYTEGPINKPIDISILEDLSIKSSEQ